MNQLSLKEVAAVSVARRVSHRTVGVTHGPITRLMRPGDLGQILKPFVFLDLFDIDLHDPQSQFSIHPHSGLATITVIADGDLRFDDPADGSGRIAFGGFEWMRAGAGVWHGRELSAGESHRAKGFQLWIALGPEHEHETVESQYMEAQLVPTTGPARVILGTYDGMRSPARAPDGLTYLMLRLPAGAQWTFVPPDQQTVAWLAVASGELEGDTAAKEGEMLLFEQSGQPFTVQAGPIDDTVLVIGSAVPHAHELHLGRYSVHTSAESLMTGEANIERLRKLLIAAGDRRLQSGIVPILKD
ncbi:pirin family protein [Paucibacter sp. M5-1]|uniref:pirin family protein n=1 Tax=Paucibacter sp. M5-1 TaxID=3015998 RepID=UPI0022B8E93E|nr:pirin family protein [Paucibacter sp. M5-1]MCZ7880600.1 pirin family protein [Paucibacter sp. M5-1]